MVSVPLLLGPGMLLAKVYLLVLLLTSQANIWAACWPSLHFHHTKLRKYSTHTGRSSGPLTGEASMLSRPG